MNAFRAIEAAWMLAIIAVLVAVMFAVTGCTEVQCVKPIINIERPTLPTVTALELEPISFETYAKLRERDLLLHQYSETLEMTIRELAEVPE
jgi:hypothetical protein